MPETYSKSGVLALKELSRDELDIAYSVTDKWMMQAVRLGEKALKMHELEPDNPAHVELFGYADAALRFLKACLSQVEQVDEGRAVKTEFGTRVQDLRDLISDEE